MEYFALFLFLLALLVLITRPFTVLFHELGHAIPALLLTKERVTIYIGSYGDPSKSLNLNLGFLEIWFRFNPFAWRGGLCVPSAPNVSINRQIIYTLSGPLASFFIGCIACYLTFSFDLHGALKLFFVVFLGSTIFDLFVDLIPNKKRITLYSGSFAYNDGYSLQRLFYYKKFSKEYEQASHFYNQGRYADAAHLFNSILTKGFKDEHLFQLAIASYLQVGNYYCSKDLIDDLILRGNGTSDDYANAGFVYSQCELHNEALDFYDKSLQQNANNKLSLNNKGYTLNLLDRYAEAIPLFDKAIEIDKTFAYSYNNRGLSKIKIGKTNEGLEDIKQSFELDKDNSYAYRNLGIYHLDRGEFDEAYKLFIKSKELDPSTHMIDNLIDRAKR
jgi:tetratricopeptide (TPR) repeat protein